MMGHRNREYDHMQTDRPTGVSAAHNVLVIDDDAIARATVRAILEDAGYRVTCAENGRQGLKAFRESRPDVVVTDIVMPDKEGLETIVELRALWPNGPIIAISGGGRTGGADNYLELARGLGANAILRKPFEPADLLSCLRSCQT
jgi:CheY-like chemotaxis protein